MPLLYFSASYRLQYRSYSALRRRFTRVEVK
jgi:hypothetical protein